ncbi:hypothetical protein B0H16DRAFT_65445 [Mycena metata]|uniref:Nephrocystin 3-like N-terminal domain-containing protein n=1 Tax=Mycena metata TaxID=1033252 RepID=A0AAD7IB42_9AGAR|nr:hypothetical protein B0H16DRAFT_65445 [Mycena metata]
MFSGSDFQVHGGTFYNVGGDINLETHHHTHLEIPSLPVPTCLPLQGSRGRGQGIDDIGGTRLYDPEDSAGRSELGFSGATRNPGFDPANTRQTAYDAAARLDCAINSTSDEGLPGSFPSAQRPMRDLHTGPRTATVDNDPAYVPDAPSLHPSYQYPNSNPPPSSHGGIYITAQNVYNQREESGMNILHRSVALEALYDSADSFPQPKCHPETRTEMLHKLYEWLTGDNTVQPICWLHGPAGAGKSAIMQTLSRQLQDSRHLGGAFFFKRHHPTRGNAKAMFTTLAYQLALNNRDLGLLVSESVERDPSIVGREMQVQFHQLIVEPCRLFDSAPEVLLLDGLDECQNETIQRQILWLIGSAARQYPTKFRFLIASRPEAHICDVFNNPSFDGLIDSTNIEQSFGDVRTYLKDEFTRIHREHWHTMKLVQTPWPSPQCLEDLVAKSSGYFVYVSTIVKFIDDQYSRPTEQLETIQNMGPTQSNGPFEALDQLYIQILSVVPVRYRSQLPDILQCVIYSFDLAPFQIDLLLGLQPGDTRLVLRGLHSVLSVSDFEYGTISVYHASFLDFLQVQERSLGFHVGLGNRLNVTRAVLLGVSKLDNPIVSCLSKRILIECLTSVPPSLELVPFIRKIDPSFIWLVHPLPELHQGELSLMVTWLEGIQPLPEDLIQRWNAYHLMARLEDVPRKIGRMLHMPRYRSSDTPVHLHPLILHTLQLKLASILPLPLARYHEFVVQNPKCIRILQVMWLLGGIMFSSLEHPFPLAHLRLVLDESWDNMVDTFSPLCSIIYGEAEQPSAITAAVVTILALSLELLPASGLSALGNLACGCLRLLKADLPLNTQMTLTSRGQNFHEQHWGTIVCSSPPWDSELLHLLHEFTPHWELISLSDERPEALYPAHFRRVLQWLQSHPNLPTDLITRWESYVDKSTALFRSNRQRGRHATFSTSYDVPG